jgi:hypothetical protein
LICARPLRSIGFLRSHRALAVSDGCRGLFSSDTVRRLVAQAVSSSRRLLASSQCFRTVPAPNRNNIQAIPSGAPSLEFACPHDDISQPYRYRIGPSSSRCLFVPGVPPAFDAFIHDRPCEFISPRSRLQDSLFKGFPSYTATMPRRHRFAFLSVPPDSLLAVAHQRHLPGSRLQGFAPCRSPLSARWGLATATARSLLEFFPLQVLLSLPVPRKCYLPLPPIALCRVCHSHPRHRRTAC